MKTTTKAWFAVVAMALATGAGATVTSEARAQVTCSATDAAQLVRLHGELQKLSGKNAHAGVLRTFRDMQALERRSCSLDLGDYKLAGLAARATGDIGNAIAWLDKAGASTDSADLRARFGQVEIKEKKGDLTKDGGVPFPPDESTTLALGVAAVKSTGKYVGYLPIGTYKLGSKSFEVKAGTVTKV
ncbi:MAG: hypothetical protein U0174_11970 [Polyangiaceae bacterium]